MDLNARPTLNFWDIFGCCQISPTGKDDENATEFSTTDNYAFTRDMTNPSAANDPNTPTTVATTDHNEVASEETEQESNGKGKESALVNNDKIASLAKEEQDDIPDMDSYLNDNGEGKEYDTATQNPIQTAASEVSFVHFFICMVFRHIFGGPLLVKAFKQQGPLLVKAYKQQEEMSKWEKFVSLMSLTPLGSNKSLPSDKDDDQSSKDSRPTMKLRQLKLDEGKCEVHPLLSEA